MSGDPTRYEDLKELYHARESANSVVEREQYDRMMYEVKIQDDEELISARQDLVGTIRVSDGRSTKRVSERIKHLTHKKGLERRG